MCVESKFIKVPRFEDHRKQRKNNSKCSWEVCLVCSMGLGIQGCWFNGWRFGPIYTKTKTTKSSSWSQVFRFKVSWFSLFWLVQGFGPQCTLLQDFISSRLRGGSPKVYREYRQISQEERNETPFYLHFFKKKTIFLYYFLWWFLCLNSYFLVFSIEIFGI